MPITVVGLAKRSNGSLRFNKCELGPSRLLSLPLFFSVTLHIISFEPRGKHPRPPPLERRLQRHNHYVTYFCHTGHITYSFTTSSVHTTTCYLSRPSARRGRRVGAACGGGARGPPGCGGAAGCVAANGGPSSGGRESGAPPGGPRRGGGGGGGGRGLFQGGADRSGARGTSSESSRGPSRRPSL